MLSKHELYNGHKINTEEWFFFFLFAKWVQLASVGRKEIVHSCLHCTHAFPLSTCSRGFSGAAREWTEAERPQPPLQCTFSTIWLADRLLLFTHPIFIPNLCGNYSGWVEDGILEMFIRRPIVLFSLPLCGLFFHSPFPSHPLCFASLSLFFLNFPAMTGGYRRQLIAGECQRQIVDPH